MQAHTGRWSPLARRISRIVQASNLLERGHHVLVALSGGPDSTALLLLLLELASAWRLTVTGVHFNYRLRGTESDEDQAFVVGLCESLGVRLVARRLVLGRRTRGSVQAEARDVRYRAMSELARDVGADRVALGHTADDQAETLFMWMLRGAGTTGLAGIPLQRERLFVRPLLSTTRDEILAYLAARGQTFRRDSSNDKPIYFRNRIRTELLPVVKRLAPAAVRALQRQAAIVAEEDRVLEQMAVDLRTALIQEEAPGVRFRRYDVLALPRALQRRLIRLVLRDRHPRSQAASFGVVESAVRFIRHAVSGRQLNLSVARLVREGDVIRITSPDRERIERSERTSRLELPVAIPSRTYWAGTGQQIHVQLLARRDAGRFLNRKDRFTAVFDADRLPEPLLLRTWRAGDRFHPAGMRGKSKKLQDFFTDLKLPRRERDRVPLLVAGREIVWVVGMRPDERFRPQESTVRCVIAEAVDEESEGGTR